MWTYETKPVQIENTQKFLRDDIYELTDQANRQKFFEVIEQISKEAKNGCYFTYVKIPECDFDSFWTFFSQHKFELSNNSFYSDKKIYEVKIAWK